MPDTRVLDVLIDPFGGGGSFALRPSPLTEDGRHMALSAVQLDAVRPRLELWLAHVFKVMGGFVAATRVLMITPVAASFRPSLGSERRRADPRDRFHRLDGGCEFLRQLAL